LSDFYIWEGVYRSFSEAPSVGPGFSGPEHRRRAVESAREAIDAVKRGVPMRRFLTQRTTVLPAVVASTLTGLAKISVLDFGGGLGIGYLTLLETIPGVVERLEYHIVDLPVVCDAGRELFASAKGLAFHDELPDPAKKFDVVYSSSAIQYVEDWQAILRALTAYRAPAFLLSDVFAGDIPTYCSLQNYYDSKIVQWFHNLGDMTDTLSSAGYWLGLKTHVAIERKGRSNGLEMQNLPEQCRLPETLTLLFQTERQAR